MGPQARMKLSPRESFLAFGSPLIEDAEINEVIDSLRSGWLVTGPKVAKFEEMFRQYTGAAHAVAVNSCTAALHLSLLVSGIQPGDEVITSPMTFCATANIIIHTGAIPVFADCQRDTLLLDPERVEAAITPRTRAIIPVHLCGRPCNMVALLDIAKRHNLVVIEDAAHAIESTYKERKVGQIGDLTAFSFYATKNVVTGEGGMITTENPEYAEKLKTYALHGMSKDAWKRFSPSGYKHYQVVFPGFKYNMMDLQAALGIHQLARVERNLRRRNQIASRYNEAFADLPMALPAKDEPGTTHARHLYPLMVGEDRCGVTRDEFMLRMHGRNVGTGVHYIGIHLQPYYRDRFGFQPEDFPNATWVSERTVSIPLSPKLSDEDVEHVVDAVRASVVG